MSTVHVAADPVVGVCVDLANSIKRELRLHHDVRQFLRNLALIVLNELY